MLGRQLREAGTWGAVVSVERMLLDIDFLRFDVSGKSDQLHLVE